MGSFKYKDKIDQVIGAFKSSGVRVLAPTKGKIIDEVSGFTILDSDNSRDPAQIEWEFCSNFPNATFLYIVCKDNYAGLTVSYEIGRAMMLNKPLYSLSPLNPDLDEHPVWVGIAKTIKTYSPREVAKMAKEGNFDLEGYWWCKQVF